MNKKSTIDQLNAPPKDNQNKAEEGEGEGDYEEEKIETGDNEHIDSNVDLHSLPETEDVVFEFYYNRTKVPSVRTIYELINYQPTHRSIADPYIIYYRIVDRSEQKEEENQEISEESCDDDDEEYHITRKQTEIMNDIKSN